MRNLQDKFRKNESTFPNSDPAYTNHVCDGLRKDSLFLCANKLEIYATYAKFV